MDNNANMDIMDKLTKVCICKAIPRSKIKDAIKNGAKTVDAVNKATGSGSGGCCGRRCGPKIQALIDSYN